MEPLTGIEPRVQLGNLIRECVSVDFVLPGGAVIAPCSRSGPTLVVP